MKIINKSLIYFPKLKPAVIIKFEKELFPKKREINDKKWITIILFGIFKKKSSFDYKSKILC